MTTPKEGETVNVLTSEALDEGRVATLELKGVTKAELEERVAMLEMLNSTLEMKSPVLEEISGSGLVPVSLSQAENIEINTMKGIQVRRKLPIIFFLRNGFRTGFIQYIIPEVSKMFGGIQRV